LQEPKTNIKTSHPWNQSKSRIWGAETPEPIATIKHGEDQLRGFGVARGQNLSFSIDLLCRHYNTLGLPCEYVKQERIMRGNIMGHTVKAYFLSFVCD